MVKKEHQRTNDYPHSATRFFPLSFGGGEDERTQNNAEASLLT